MATQRRLNLRYLKLYGRENEVMQLKSVYRRIGQGGAESLLIRGPAGVGKTHLVEKTFLKEDCYFASGTIQHGDGPFSSVVHALSELIVMLCDDEEIYDAITDSIFDELTDYEIADLSNFIPKFDDFFGDDLEFDDQSSSTCWSTSAHESMMKRFVAIRKFLRILCEESDGPLILCIHNLHSADRETMQMVEFIANDQELEYFLFVGTYRDDQEANNALLSWVKQADNSSRWNVLNPVVPMRVKGVSIIDVNLLLSDVMNLDEGDTFPLATIILDRTNGSMYFVLQILEYWQSEKLLTYDVSRFRWMWNLDKMKDTALMDNVVDDIACRIKNQPAEVHCVLTIAACIGQKLDSEAIEICAAAVNKTPIDVPKVLAHCVTERIFERLSDGRVRFFHDKIHEAVKNLANDPDDLAKFSLRLGISLWGYLSSQKEEAQKIDDKLLFICAEQLSIGVTHVETNATKVSIVQILAGAGMKATTLSAFVTAANYFETAIKLLEGLGEESEDHFFVLMTLHVSYAEVKYYTGHCTESMKAIDFVLSNQPTTTASLRLKVLRLRILKSQCRLVEFINSSLEFLEELGENIPRHTTNSQVRSEAQKTAKRLRKMTDQDILSLPRTNSIVMGVLNAMLVPLERLGMYNLAHFTICRAVQLSIKNGVTEVSPESFALFGTYLISEKQELIDGYRYGELALKLSKKINRNKLDARVVHWTSLCTKTWQMVPLSKCVDTVYQGHLSAMREGDPFTAFMTIDAYFSLSFCSSLDLRPLLRDIEEFSAQMLQYGQKMVYLQILPIWQCILNLSGRSSDPLNMTRGEALDNRSLVGKEGELSSQSCWTYLMHIAFYMGDLELASTLSAKLQALNMGTSKASCLYPSMVFLFCLIAIGKARSTGKRKFKLEACKHLLLMRQWVGKKAANLVPKLMILESEYETLEHKSGVYTNRPKYDCAIAAARKSGFLQDAALASQLAGEQVLRDPALADYYAASYFLQAIQLWKSWGAIAVANKLKMKQSDILNATFNSAASDTEESTDEEVKGSNYRGRRRFDRRVSLGHQRQLSDESLSEFGERR